MPQRPERSRMGRTLVYPWTGSGDTAVTVSGTMARMAR